MPRCYPNIYRCIQCLPWHCQSVLILWILTVAWISSISLWEEQWFTLRNLHFWDQLKASISSNICPDCISCHLEFQNFQREDPRTPHQPRGGTPHCRTHLFSCLRRSGTCLWHVQFPPTSKNSPSTLKLLENPASIGASHQVSVHLAKKFQRRRFLEINQPETRIAYGSHVC